MNAGARHLKSFPTALMLLAALLSYFGAPRISALTPLARGGLEAMRMLDLSQRLRSQQALAALKPLSIEAQRLAAEIGHGSEALKGAIGAGELVSAPAPALGDSSLSYVAPRPQLLAPDFAQGFAGLLPEGIQNFTRPPPFREWALSLLQAPLPFSGSNALSRAPPVSLR
jgi:hypothetical protein